MKKILKTLFVLSAFLIVLTACGSDKKDGAVTKEEYNEKFIESTNELQQKLTEQDCDYSSSECIVESINISIDLFFKPLSKMYVEDVEKTKEIQSASKELVDTYEKIIDLVEKGEDITSDEFYQKEIASEVQELEGTFSDLIDELITLGIIEVEEEINNLD